MVCQLSDPREKENRGIEKNHHLIIINTLESFEATVQLQIWGSSFPNINNEIG